MDALCTLLNDGRFVPENVTIKTIDDLITINKLGVWWVDEMKDGVFQGYQLTGSEFSKYMLMYSEKDEEWMAAFAYMH